MTDVTALLRSAGFAGEGLEVRTVARPEALRGSTLAALVSSDDALAAAVDDYADLQQQQFGPTAARHVAALWLLQDVTFAHAVLAAGLIGAHGVSLLLPADGLAMELPRDMFFGVQIAQDAVASHAATSNAERTDLYRGARAHLADLLAALREPLGPHLRAGSRAFWACVTDTVTGVICSGNRDAASKERALESFDDGTPPMLSGERLVPSPTGPIRRRHGCCLLYTIEGMSLCFSCPRMPLT